MVTGPIHLFVSSSPDLSAEREIIGQVIAELPLTIGWRIGHTPLPGQGSSNAVVVVERCDLYVLILGSDFFAPMGAELRQAVANGRVPLAFHKKCTRSPSAQDALRRVEAGWRAFSTPEELRSLFADELMRTLLQRATELGLELHELERLSELARKPKGKAEAKGDRGVVDLLHPGEGDADRSGVILGREVWEAGARKRP